MSLYSDVLFVSEMLLKAAPLHFESALSCATNPNAPIYAVDLILTKEWLSRIGNLFAIVKRKQVRRDVVVW